MLAVSRLFHILLLVAASLGLIGQGMAFAAAPLAVSSTLMAAVPESDCAAMASMGDEDPSPCKGLTAACIEKMGCIAPFTYKDPHLAQASPDFAPAMEATWPPVHELAGLSGSPELDPPTTLV